MSARRLLPLALTLLLAGFTAHGEAPARWAVVVGVGDYTHFGDEPGGDLPGAANDARAVRDVLVARWGFPADNVRLLLDGQATRAAIEGALTEWLPKQASAGDLVVFYFAGHGSQAWDQNGDEPDGLDETICPVDVMAGSTDNDIPDDELAGWLRGLPTDNITVIFDKCFAESSTRAATPFARTRSLARDIEADVPRPRNVAAGGSGDEAADAFGGRVLELAASQDDEVAVDVLWEDAGEFGGAFTTNLVRYLWQVPTTTSYEDVFRLTAEALREQRFAQTPSISGAGAASRPVFSVDGATTAAAGAVPVLQVDGRNVRLGGGSLAGITEGSVYTAAGVSLRVLSVERGHADAVALDGVTPEPGASARLSAYAAPAAVLLVQVSALADATREALAAALRDVAGIELVPTPRGFAHLLVRPAESGYAVLGLDGAVRHEVERVTDLAPRLAVEAGAHQLGAIDNPARPFPMAVSLSDDRSKVGLGEEVAFRVRVGRDGYLTLVDLGTDGVVRVLYPNPLDPDNRVLAGAQVTVPTATMDMVFRAMEPVGRGMVRAFLTERPLELELEGTGPTEAVKIAQALRRAVGTEDRAIPIDTWATAAVAYEITR